jgi:hypothetical protein
MKRQKKRQKNSSEKGEENFGNVIRRAAKNNGGLKNECGRPSKLITNGFGKTIDKTFEILICKEKKGNEPSIIFRGI